MFTNDVTLYKQVVNNSIQTKDSKIVTIDKVFVDDDNHVKCFQNYGKFNHIMNNECLAHKCKGRDLNEERILAYNIGLVHD